ncbi:MULTISPECIES: hypothetical protein [Kocuria]|uniref:hypothetical protein n=1 Tax=Kocuria TaxID=57493 RepID=UPI0008A596BC|nr:hypothetical protein [Kocuria sp. HMSC066H03]OFK07853.1 hypothetical protein HMPREF2833_09740 [Kocuria sp. HMSC066H03]
MRIRRHGYRRQLVVLGFIAYLLGLVALSFTTDIGTVLATALVSAGVCLVVSAVTLSSTQERPASPVSVEPPVFTQDDKYKLLRYTSTTEYRTRDDGRRESALVRTRDLQPVIREISRAREALESLQVSQQQLEGVPNAPTRSSLELHRPNGIAATAQSASRGAAIGRYAASVESDPRREHLLAQLLTPDEHALPPLAHVIGSDQLLKHLRHVCTVSPMSPSHLTVAPEASWFIMETSQFHCGAWDLALTAASTRRYDALRHLLRQAHSNGTVLVLLADDHCQAIFSNDLAALCDVVIDQSSASSALFGWTGDENLPVIARLNAYMRERTNA